jgi:phytoene dehydrogenase-like protein
MDETYDGIILGASHNGMIAQAYLCKAGLKVLSIDRRPLFGGGLTTEEEPEFPGYLHNTHAVFCRAVTSLAWYRDLELERHGLTMIEPEMNVALMTRDHDVLQWWTDFEKTDESVAQFSRNDADTLRRWYEEFVPSCRRSSDPNWPRRRCRLSGGARCCQGRRRARGYWRWRNYRLSSSCSASSSIPSCRPVSSSSTACAKWICG